MKVVFSACLLLLCGLSTGVATTVDDFAEAMKEMKNTMEILRAEVTTLHGNKKNTIPSIDQRTLL